MTTLLEKAKSIKNRCNPKEFSKEINELILAYIEGEIKLSQVSKTLLIDSGKTHSFVSQYVIRLLRAKKAKLIIN